MEHIIEIQTLSFPIIIRGDLDVCLLSLLD